MRNQVIFNLRLVFITALTLLPYKLLLAQTQVMAWGNITGIRVEGQLMEFESSMRVVAGDWSRINSTGKEKQRPKYDREGEMQTVTTDFGGFRFSQEVKENGSGSSIVKIMCTADKDTVITGVYFCLDLPAKYYSAGTLRINGSSKKQNLSDKISTYGKINNVTARSINIESEKQQLALSFNEASSVIVRKQNENSGYQVYIRLMGPEIKKEQKAEKTVTIKSTGVIDKSTVEIKADIKNPGRKFDGFGGNFRLQNPKSDPLVIDYCLDNMRVAWGRVEMPWAMWHPEENNDPVEAARSGKLNKHVYESMLMAQKLSKKGMPVIVSDWTAPEWAVIPRTIGRNQRGVILNPAKIEKIYKSIGDYIVYLKKNYGVESVAFSFNESDIGINVLQTPQEHADFIKGFGKHMALRGLATRLLLGDNSDATTFDFILSALNDPETHKYIEAVSFHSWRGCDDATLRKWAGAAKELNVPLIVAEGSTDAAAWNYPEIFFEQTFALYEINLYIRICSICQPLSILQWQLTSDYSVLRGEGIFRTVGPLTPTRRFWNLKQLASTPEDAFSIPFACSKEEVNCALFGNIARGKYAIHIVNNGAERPAEIKGLPSGSGLMDVFVTDASRGMEKIGETASIDGLLKLNLPAAAMISLISKP
jgi:hypothetical protein